MFTCTFRKSNGVRLITVAVVALFASIPLVILFLDDWRKALLIALIMLLPASIVWFFWQETPVRLEADDREIRIVMRSGNCKVIRLGTVRSVEPLDRRQMRWTLRMGGNGGVGGFTGLFWNRTLGWFGMYATSLKGLVLVRMLDGKKYVIGCGSDPLAADLVTLLNEKNG